MASPNTGPDFSIYEGDSFPITVTVNDQSGTPVNIQGATLKWVLVSGTQVTRYKDNQTDGGITITNAQSGQFTISVLASDTTGLPPGQYTHEARMIDSNGNSKIIFIGTITIEKSYV